MRIAYITAGAAGRYCGNCLQDNLLARELRRLGHDVVLLPTYTPIRTEDEDASSERLFYNGARVWLEQRFRFFRRPRPWIDRVLDSRWVVSRLSRWGASTDPGRLGEIAVSVLRGEEGHQRRELEELVRWLGSEFRPEVVVLTNGLLVGLARRLREGLGVPVLCRLQCEDSFLDALPPPHRNAALDLLRDRSRWIDLFLPVSRYYSEHAGAEFGLPPSKQRVVSPGIRLDGHERRPRDPSAPLAIGFLARLAPEKGLHLLCDAFRSLAGDPRFPDLRLRVAGYLAREQRSWVDRLWRELRHARVDDRVELIATVDREEKLAFLASVDVLAVPTLYPDPKGLFALEAMASGVPVVVPAHGAFPEILDRVQGGVLHEPEDVVDLTASLRGLLEDRARRRRLGRAARDGARREFGADRMAREFEDVLREAVEPGSRAGGGSRDGDGEL